MSQPAPYGAVPNRDVVHGHGRARDHVWPGEFVFGYPTQHPTCADLPGLDRLSDSAPAWARNGSLLVFRRLRQHVHFFHRFVRNIAAERGLSAELVAARLVGRWPSGAPLVHYPEKDPGHYDASDDYTFDYRPDCGDSCAAALDPLTSAHIRKVHPRGVVSAVGNSIPSPADTQRHRILRRGITYGRESRSTPECPLDDGRDRGLLFVAYQSSIEEQFEFITRRWANEPNFPEPLSGHDPIIGQAASGGDRRLHATPDGYRNPLSVDRAWVSPTGDFYGFAPGRATLAMLAGG